MPMDVAASWWVFLFALGVTVATGVLFWTAPARKARGTDPALSFRGVMEAYGPARSYWGGGGGTEPAGGGQAVREVGGMSESLRGQTYSPAYGMPGPMGRMTGVSG